MTQDKYSLWKDKCARVAWFVARDFPEVEYEDLFHDIMMQVLSSPKLTNPDQHGMTSVLRRIAVKMAWEYRKQGLYISAQYAYRTSDVRKILETIFFDDDLSRTYLPEDQISQYLDDKMAAASDVKFAFSKLSDSHKATLIDVYVNGAEPSKNKNRFYAALERITDILNFYNRKTGYVGPGSRKLMSRAHEKFIIEEEYSGRGREGRDRES